jgi:hypothetical protein
MPGPPARSRSTHHHGGLIEARRGLTEPFGDETADQARAIVAGSAARPSSVKEPSLAPTHKRSTKELTTPARQSWKPR